MAENERIATFSPTLHERLKQAYESSTAKVNIGRPRLNALLYLCADEALFMLALMLTLVPSTVSLFVMSSLGSV